MILIPITSGIVSSANCIGAPQEMEGNMAGTRWTRCSGPIPRTFSKETRTSRSFSYWMSFSRQTAKH